MKAAICQPQMGKEALLGLLSAKSEGERAFVFDAAREARHRAFGNKVFLYGFLYLSTHCRNDCAFCQYRRSNSSLERYRKPLGEMLEAAGRLGNGFTKKDKKAILIGGGIGIPPMLA